MRLNKALLLAILCLGYIVVFENFVYADDYQTDGESADDYGVISQSTTVSYGDYSYAVSSASGGVYITDYTGDETDLVIPETLNGYTVVGLYSECFATASNLTTVTIPSTVTGISTDAFRNCSTLTTIKVDSSNTVYAASGGILYSKDYKYLCNCPEGKSGAVSVVSGTVYICDYSFFQAKNVTSITIPSSVQDIGIMAFYETSSLAKFSVSSSNQYLTYSGGILYNKDKTEVIKCVDTRSSAVTLASTVKTIRDYAFYGCSDLVGPLNLPSKLTTIGEYAFCGCESLTGSIEMPSTVTSLGTAAFYGCSSITSLTISTTLTSIPDDCFAYCESLTEITIPSSVKTIGERAFFYCTSVEELTIGSGVTTIGAWAFDYLLSLQGDLVIPSSVQTIGDAAFFHCPSIDGYIVIGSGVIELGVNVFYSSNSAKAIVFRGNVPSVVYVDLSYTDSDGNSYTSSAQSSHAFDGPDIKYYYLEGKTGFTTLLDGKEYYTYVDDPIVTFMVNGEVYLEVEQGTWGLTVDEPDAPEVYAYEFLGWYADEECTQEFDFSEDIMNNTTVYASMEDLSYITITTTCTLLAIGSTEAISCEYVLSDGGTFEDIVWESSDETVATVDEVGNVTGVSSGEVTITASYKDASDSITYTVFKDENAITFSYDTTRVVIGEYLELELSYHLLNSGEFEDIVWESSDEFIATVENGVVYGISEGTVIITASYEDVTEEVEVKVVRPNEISIVTDPFWIKEEESGKIEIEYYFNDDGSEDDVVWTSSDTSIATVESGVVYGVSEGTVIVTATYENVEDTIEIEVVKKDSITFSSTKIYVVNTNETYELEYEVYSYDSSEDDRVTFESSDASVATVDENGIITVIQNGVTTITAYYCDAQESVLVYIVDENYIAFLEDSITVEYRYDSEINLEYEYYFSDGATDKDFIYTSSNEDVVSVDSSNNLYIEGIGTTTLTATYGGAKDEIVVTVVSIDTLYFSKAGYLLLKGDTQTLDYVFDSYYGDSENVVFTSSDATVIKIQNGQIIATGTGVATVTASYENMSATLKIVVTDIKYLLGDLDFDNDVDAVDAALALDIYKYGGETDLEAIVGDLDFDGDIDATDAALILDVYKYGN